MQQAFKQDCTHNASMKLHCHAAMTHKKTSNRNAYTIQA
jgi:hypothetical protein